MWWIDGFMDGWMDGWACRDLKWAINLMQTPVTWIPTSKIDARSNYTWAPNAREGP